jgi:hypothetical protein
LSIGAMIANGVVAIFGFVLLIVMGGAFLSFGN